MNYTLTYLAFGAGLDSTALLLASEKGLHNVPKADLAIFADTGDEPAYVMEHVWRLSERAERTPGAIPIHVASHGSNKSLLEFLLSRLTATTTSQPPLWTLDEPNTSQSLMPWGDADRQPGQLPRACTRDFKIRVAHRYLRRFLNVRKFTPSTGIRIRALIGIAADEAHRVNVSRERWCDLAHPFVDSGVTKKDETALLLQHGWPVPEKSACVYCPYHGDDYWQWLRAKYPHEFQRACVADEAMRRFPHVRADLFVHRSRMPLRDVQFGDAPDAFGNDCSGRCNT